MLRKIPRLWKKIIDRKEQEISDFKWASFNSVKSTFLEEKAEGLLEWEDGFPKLFCQVHVRGCENILIRHKSGDPANADCGMLGFSFSNVLSWIVGLLPVPDISF